jgi:hypothetical protein
VYILCVLINTRWRPDQLAFYDFDPLRIIIKTFTNNLRIYYNEFCLVSEMFSDLCFYVIYFVTSIWQMYRVWIGPNYLDFWLFLFLVTKAGLFYGYEQGEIAFVLFKYRQFCV